MFSWITEAVKGVVAIVISGLAIIGIGDPVPTDVATTTPVIVEQTESGGVLSEIESLKLELEQEKAARTKSDTDRLYAEKAKAEADVAKSEAEKLRLQAEVDALKSSSVATQKSTVVPSGILCNGKYWNQCPSGQTFNCPPSGSATCSAPQAQQTGTNYRADFIFRVNTLIATHKSFKSWLQDTSDQLRTASLTLGGYAVGGLYAESRDNAIKLANAQVSVNTSMIANSDKFITQYQSMLNIINADPTGFVDSTTYSQLQTPEALKADIATVQKSINSTLELVLGALQYH